MRPKAEWAIDSEPIRARGIIVKYKVYHATVPEYLTQLFRNITTTSEVVRSKCSCPNLRKLIKRTFAYRWAIAWNELPNHVRDLETLNRFKAYLR